MKSTIVTIIIAISLCFIHVGKAKAQFYGTVVDGQTNEPVPYVTVKYVNTSIGCITDENGLFQVAIVPPNDKLELSAVGYKKKTVVVNYARKRQHSTIILYPDNVKLDEIIVKPRKEKYVRKNNPAVELMRKVIASKKDNRLEKNEHVSYKTYKKHTFSINEVSAKTFATGFLKHYSFLKDHVEVCSETGKLILPMMVEETVEKHLYRHEPERRQTQVEGHRSSGFNTIFSSGELFNVYIKDIFTDVNIYDDNVRLLQHPFISPLSSTEGIAFYHYYIMDTLQVDGVRCIDIGFTPSNSQDFGFTGHLYVEDNGSYQVKRSILNISRHSSVNFVDNLIVYQDFGSLSNGQRTLLVDNMTVELKYIDAITKLQVQRYTSFSDFDFSPIPEMDFMNENQLVRQERRAELENYQFWDNVRPQKLTETEFSLDSLVNKTSNLQGYKYAMLVIRALVENSVELTKKPNKFDMMPVNTILSNNYVDGFRMRIGGQTTANLNPHFFWRGFYAYGTKDSRSKYKAEMEYSFNEKKYMAHEFPRRSLIATYHYDTFSPVDKFSGTDKDNMYTSIKSSKVEHMVYQRKACIKFNYETYHNFSTFFSVSNITTNPAGKMEFVGMDGFTRYQKIKTFEMGVGFRYAPHETFICSKQKRLPVNNDAWILSFNHTMSIKGWLGSQYNFQVTEASIYKRFWLPYACGFIETYVKGGIQWDKVPFPFLFVPSSNMSYFVQFDNWSFNMLNNMEFLSDRYMSLFLNWNLNGKLLNRIPLIRKMKLREYIGCKLYYGQLSAKNNPNSSSNANDKTLFLLPTDDGNRMVYDINNKPYMELACGISNIFKFLTVEYVRRMNYYQKGISVKKNGIRFAVDITF